MLTFAILSQVGYSHRWEFHKVAQFLWIGDKVIHHRLAVSVVKLGMTHVIHHSFTVHPKKQCLVKEHKMS